MHLSTAPLDLAPAAPDRNRAVPLAVGIFALLAIAIGTWHLVGATRGVVVERQRVGEVPVTVFKPATGHPAPAVVIAHGFAGSQQLMQPFAVTLARNGFVAVTFDFPGHGRNATPLPGGLADHDGRTRALLAALASIVDFARRLSACDGRVALLGHSMASDVVVRHAQAHPEVQATVAVSLFLSRGISAASPRNLLVLYGGLESSMLLSEGARILAQAAGGAATPGVTYGDMRAGTARRLALAGGVEHIGVLYSRTSLAEALAWLNQAFARQDSGFLDTRGPWLGLLYLGLIALAWPLSKLLPRAASLPIGASCGWRPLVPLALAPALLTPLILWRTPTGFLPLLLGDYLVLHFALYGLLTAGGLWIARRASPTRSRVRVSPGRLVLAILAASAYCTLAIGVPADWFATSLAPTPARLWLIPAMLCGTLPYFAADEWLTRGPSAPPAAYAVTKLCFLLSLTLAIALNLERLFFLAIIVPAILAFFAVYGLLSRWTYRSTNHPLVGATACAVAFAWAIAVTFPIVAG